VASQACFDGATRQGVLTSQLKSNQAISSIASIPMHSPPHGSAVLAPPAPQSKPVTPASSLVAQIAPSVAFELELRILAAGPAPQPTVLLSGRCAQIPSFRPNCRQPGEESRPIQRPVEDELVASGPICASGHVFEVTNVNPMAGNRSDLSTNVTQSKKRIDNRTLSASTALIGEPGFRGSWLRAVREALATPPIGVESNTSWPCGLDSQPGRQAAQAALTLVHLHRLR
jgi:hypothetical protein